MKIQAVIGANYGDEGKGLVSGCLAREAKEKHEKTLTVFYNGTMQRAHTFEGEIHRAMAAGTKYGSDTFYHRQFVIDPISLWILQAKPIIHPLCRIILPCDVMHNRANEKKRGDARHGTCGFGLFEAVLRSLEPFHCVFAKDLQEPYSLYQKLKEIEMAFPAEYDELYNIDNFMKAAAYVTQNCQMSKIEDIAANYDTIIYEGGQGLMLDQMNMDCFPHLTPSSTGCRNIADDAFLLKPKYIELYYVSRSYLTRHGAGPIIGECSKAEINPDIIDTTNGENEWQGALRFGKLDLDLMAKKITKDALYLQRRYTTVNMVYTQLNYTDGKLETVNGKENVHTAFHADHIFVSDQKDRMERLR